MVEYDIIKKFANTRNTLKHYKETLDKKAYIAKTSSSKSVKIYYPFFCSYNTPVAAAVYSDKVKDFVIIVDRSSYTKSTTRHTTDLCRLLSVCAVVSYDSYFCAEGSIFNHTYYSSYMGDNVLNENYAAYVLMLHMENLMVSLTADCFITSKLRMKIQKYCNEYMRFLDMFALNCIPKDILDCCYNLCKYTLDTIALCEKNKNRNKAKEIISTSFFESTLYNYTKTKLSEFIKERSKTKNINDFMTNINTILS